MAVVYLYTRIWKIVCTRKKLHCYYGTSTSCEQIQIWSYTSISFWLCADISQQCQLSYRIQKRHIWLSKFEHVRISYPIEAPKIWRTCNFAFWFLCSNFLCNFFLSLWACCGCICACARACYVYSATFLINQTENQNTESVS